ncbi:phospholipase D family protein [Filobacillus milosensis]|uniref:phospholipase D n=1 Tax=Filobacillus milosensis TaxID=94137 RepID=A0A4Y8IBE7_9BACI|nr:phospholipase D-like domain-containing protein [Filobacillus milosensis]TFB13302.1 phospholipase D family protein [Filobacillus milosensis]
MDMATIVGTCTLGASIVGYILYKSSRQNDQMNMIEVKSNDGEDTIKLDYAFTKTNQKPDQILKNLIDQAKETIDLAVFTFTDKGILQSIIQATNRGVKVRLITDRKQSKNAYGQDEVLEKLTHAGVPIKENCHDGYMHLKITIVDSSVISVGSYNYTKAARNKHDEILVVIKNKKVGAEWSKHFDYMWYKTSDYRSINSDSIPSVS